MSKKRFNEREKLPKSLVYFILASCFLILGVFFKTLDIYNNIDQQVLIAQSQAAENIDAPKFVRIDRINLNLPVEGVDIIKGRWPVSKYTVSYLQSSEKLAGEGTIIIYGHNKINIFGQIGLLNNGDEINLILSNNESAKYAVSEKVIVYPHQLSALKHSDGSTLILYTCTGFADSKRVIVKAKQI